MARTKTMHDMFMEHAVVMKVWVLLGKIVSAETDLDSASLFDLLQVAREYIDGRHHSKEERHLFPEVLAMKDGETEQLVKELLDEHEKGRQLVSEITSSMKEERSTVLASMINEYRKLLFVHVRKENTLFDEVDPLIAPDKDERIFLRMKSAESDVSAAGSTKQVSMILERIDQAYGDVAIKSHVFSSEPE